MSLFHSGAEYFYPSSVVVYGRLTGYPECELSTLRNPFALVSDTTKKYTSTNPQYNRPTPKYTPRPNTQSRLIHLWARITEIGPVVNCVFGSSVYLDALRLYG